MENSKLNKISHRPFGSYNLWCVMVLTLLACLQVGCSEKARAVETADENELLAPLFQFEFDQQDKKSASELEVYVARGKRMVEEFFEMSFRDSVIVVVCPTREAFTSAFPPEWGMSETECWMVAAGVADQLIILSPRVWGEESCEHDPLDIQHVQGIVAHELVHVFHGQYNPTRDFTGAEEVGWFVEGLAVHVSGQLNQGHLAEPSEAIELGKDPTCLSEAWSGKYRYGVCGSLVMYMDRACGRDTIRKMLAVTSQADLLALSGVTESELLKHWKEFIIASNDR
jgi:hypothetical protein